MQEEKRNGDAGGHDDGQRALNLTEYPTDFVRSVLPVVEQTDHTKRAFGTARTKSSIFVINGTASFEILYYIQGSWVDYQVGLSYLALLVFADSLPYISADALDEVDIVYLLNGVEQGCF